MKELSLIVITYSLVVFILIFIFGLILFFKLRRNEREIDAVKRKLDVLLQNPDLTLQGSGDQQKRPSNAIQDSIVDKHEQLDDNEDVEFIKDALKNSEKHISPRTDSNHTEMETNAASQQTEIEEKIESTTDLKNKIIDMLNQLDKPISYEQFSKRLNEDNSFAGKQNQVFDLIDQLKDESKIEIYFAGGKLLIKPSR